MSKTVQGIAATGGASTATNVTYNNGTSRLNSENAQDVIDDVDGYDGIVFNRWYADMCRKGVQVDWYECR